MKSDPNRKKRSSQRGHRKAPLKPSEQDRLYAAADDLLDKVIIAVLIDTGLRVSELASLTIDHVLYQQDRIRFKGKGGVVRTVPMSPRAREHLAKWFTHNDGFPGPRAIQMRVKRVAEAAKIVKKVTPHTLRHSFAVNSLRKGVHVRALQRVMGHASLETTELYLKIDDEDVMKEYQEKLGW